jgi:FKBP-type peptidyl-prolyl cis-trans isomerase
MQTAVFAISILLLAFALSAALTMGFEKKILRAGSGVMPVKGRPVTVHCTGFGKDRDLAQKFWSTKDPGQKPFTFNIGLGQVIKGWDEGVMGMVSNCLLSVCL